MWFRLSLSLSRYSRGIPIGNLTSQIFANIYLNELDRFVIHLLKPQAYLRYGDDFVVFVPTQAAAVELRTRILSFCRDELGLTINPKQDVIVPVRRGLHFLGVEIYPTGRRLRARHWQRIQDRLTSRNIASYRELIARHNPKQIRWFNWLVKTRVCDISSAPSS